MGSGDDNFCGSLLFPVFLEVETEGFLELGFRCNGQVEPRSSLVTIPCVISLFIKQLILGGFIIHRLLIDKWYLHLPGNV